MSALFYSVLTTAPIVASSSGSGYYPFLMNANQVTVENLGLKHIWVTFDVCSTAATTGGNVITACSEHQSRAFTFADWASVRKVTIFATSTVADEVQFGITAIG